MQSGTTNKSRNTSHARFTFRRNDSAATIISGEQRMTARTEAMRKRGVNKACGLHLTECLESRLMLAAGPFVEEIKYPSPAGPTASGPMLRYLVVFSEPVTGV